MASIALSYGIKANVVHKWRLEAGGALHARQATVFVPVPLPPSACSPGPALAQDIRIELRRSATAASVTLPLDAADQCAVWMRELLK